MVIQMKNKKVKKRKSDEIKKMRLRIEEYYVESWRHIGMGRKPYYWLILSLLAFFGKPLRKYPIMKFCGKSKRKTELALNKLTRDGLIIEDKKGEKEVYYVINEEIRSYVLSKLTKDDIEEIKKFIENELKIPLSALS